MLNSNSFTDNQTFLWKIYITRRLLNILKLPRSVVVLTVVTITCSQHLCCGYCGILPFMSHDLTSYLCLVVNVTLLIVETTLYIVIGTEFKHL